MTSLAISLYRPIRGFCSFKQPFSAFRAAYFDKLQSAHSLLFDHITYSVFCNCSIFSPYAARSFCREPRQEEVYKAAVGFAPIGGGSSDRSFYHVTPPRFGRGGIAPPLQRLRSSDKVQGERTSPCAYVSRGSLVLPAAFTQYRTRAFNSSSLYGLHDKMCVFIGQCPIMSALFAFPLSAASVDTALMISTVVFRLFACELSEKKQVFYHIITICARVSARLKDR